MKTHEFSITFYIITYIVINYYYAYINNNNSFRAQRIKRIL